MNKIILDTKENGDVIISNGKKFIKDPLSFIAGLFITILMVVTGAFLVKAIANTVLLIITLVVSFLVFILLGAFLYGIKDLKKIEDDFIKGIYSESKVENIFGNMKMYKAKDGSWKLKGYYKLFKHKVNKSSKG